jgi:arylsulfatase A-like enzyme
LSGILEAREVAEFSDRGDCHSALHATQGLEGFDYRFETPGGNRFLEFLCQTLEPFGVLAYGADIFLENDLLGRGGTDHFRFMTDMTTQAIAWVRFQQTMTPDRPFFIYFAPGATHAPHHVPKEWADKYKGKFDGGWDRYRSEALARQIKLGIVPPDTKLAPKPAAIKDWDTLSADEKQLFAHQMEVFAGFAEQTDHEIGRQPRHLS